MDGTLQQRIEINGEPAGAGDLRLLVAQNYGHFTAMQVRGGCVQGLDLHLDRLQRATRELFGHDLDLADVRAWMRRAVAGVDAASLRVNVYSRHFDRDRPSAAVSPDVLVTTAPPRMIDAAPLRVRCQRHDRDAPHIKHVGTFGLFHQRRLAQQHGFDDALFVTADGAISEGTVWNVGFFDGERIVWPQAPMLRGTALQLLQSGLEQAGFAQHTRRVDRDALGGFRAAFFTNSSRAVQPIALVDDVRFDADDMLFARLGGIAAAVPWQPI